MNSNASYALFHTGKPIFSIDIHPDGSKFATGGQGKFLCKTLLKDCYWKYVFASIGDDSGRVVIWNVAPIVKEQAEEDDNVPKLLCQMDNHLGIYICLVK